MAVAMKISDELVNDAKPYAAAEHRSVPKQIITGAPGADLRASNRI